ncbi:hypothetical protein [Dapis sp. BLCC M126]
MIKLSHRLLLTFATIFSQSENLDICQEANSYNSLYTDSFSCG